MKSFKALITPLTAALLLFGLTANTYADTAVNKKTQTRDSGLTDAPRTQSIAMNNAVNMQTLYDPDNVDIEIVAYGPGLGMLTKKSELTPRVKSLAMQDVKISACMNTMNKVKEKTGKRPQLTEGVGTVPAGVASIMELQEDHYSFIRP